MIAICVLQAQYNFIYEVLAAAAMTSVPVPAEKFNLSAVLREENGTVAVRQEFQVNRQSQPTKPPSFVCMH